MFAIWSSQNISCDWLCLLPTADIISTVEFNYSGDLLATGDKGGRVVIFQREQEVSALQSSQMSSHMLHILLPRKETVFVNTQACCSYYVEYFFKHNLGRWGRNLLLSVRTPKLTMHSCLMWVHKAVGKSLRIWPLWITCLTTFLWVTCFHVCMCTLKIISQWYVIVFILGFWKQQSWQYYTPGMHNHPQGKAAPWSRIQRLLRASPSLQAIGTRMEITR